MADLHTILGSITIMLIVSLVAFCIIFYVIMSTAYENLKKLLELAIRQLKEIKENKKKFDEEELIGLEARLTDLVNFTQYK